MNHAPATPRRFELVVLMLEDAAIPLTGGVAIEVVEDGVSAWTVSVATAGEISPSPYAQPVRLVTAEGGELRGRALVEVVAVGRAESSIDVRFADPPAVRYRRLRAVG